MHSQAALRSAPSLRSLVRDRGQIVLWYTQLISLIGLLFVIWSLVNLPRDWSGLLLFACMAIVAELLSVEMLITTKGSRVSVSSAISIASIVAFGPLAGVLTQLACGIANAVATAVRRSPESGSNTSLIRRASFNTSMIVIAAAVAGYVYLWLGGVPGEMRHIGNGLPLIGAAASGVIINIAILTGVLWLQTARRPLIIWREDFAAAMPIAVLGNLVGGGVLALSYGVAGMFGALVFFLPILATGYSFRVYFNNMRQYVIRLEDANRSLDEANLGLLEALGSVIDAYDVYTYGHSRQVAQYAAAIAERAGLSAEEQHKVVRAALIHDVGKVGVSDAVIGKQAPLTHEEYSLVKRHPIIGAEIVGQMKALQDLALLVKHHHERWDGQGYPDGLAGEDIPLGARILSLADTLDAMCSDRPYRPPMRFEEILAEISRQAGSHFDPQLAQIVLQLAVEKGPSFFRNSAVEVDTMLLPIVSSRAGLVGRYLKKSMLG